MTKIRTLNIYKKMMFLNFSNVINWIYNNNDMFDELFIIFPGFKTKFKIDKSIITTYYGHFIHVLQ